MNFEVQWGPPNAKTRIDIPEIPVPIVGLAPSLTGLRLAVVSDLHYGLFVWGAYAARVVRLVNAQRPDVICLPGDLINGPRKDLRPFIQAMARMRAPLGKFACLGNHEYSTGVPSAASALRQAGVNLLVNARQRIAVDGNELVIAGLDDHRMGRPDLATALAGLDDGLPVILLCHNPDHAESLDGDTRVDLMLSGHTHGGQIVICGRALSTQTVYRKYCSGMVAGPHCPVYISRGVGVVGVPLRVACRPEIPIFRLVPGR